MASKKNKKSSKKPASKPEGQEEGLGYNPFASLKGRIKEEDKATAKSAKAARTARVEKAQASAPRAEPTRAARAAPSTRAPGAVEMSAAELFASAVEGLGPVEIERGKYAGRGPDTSHIRVKEEKTLAPAEIAKLGAPDDPFHEDLAYFEEIMGADRLRPMQNNLHVRDPDEALQDAARRLMFQAEEDIAETPQTREAQLDELDREGGPRLTMLQRQLLREARKQTERGGPLPMVNIRGLGRVQGVAKVADLAMANSLSGRPYMRVITGKGIQSEERPVLKRAVVDWALTVGEELVLSWAPEVEADGSFGALILQVRRQQRRRKLSE